MYELVTMGVGGLTFVWNFLGGGGTTYEWLYARPLSFLTISDCKESISRNEIEMKPPTPMQHQCNSVSILMSVQRI